MSTTVTYKGNTLTTVNNTTKTLKTAGKYMEGDVVLTDVTEEYIGGAVYQDQDGYLVLSDQGSGSSVTVEALNVTQNGTYTAPIGKAYSPVTVSVSGGGSTPTPTPTPWVRPSDWPDLSQMDVSDGDIIYMTSYADEARGFCAFTVNCTGNYTVEVGSISGSTFTADSTYTYSSDSTCQLYYGSSAGGYKVLRITGTSIRSLTFRSGNALTIDGHACYVNNQGIIDIVGKLPSGRSITCSNQYNLINMKISGLKLSANRSGMFTNCYSLTSIDVSDWDTSSVTDMGSMFSSCYSLTYLDVSRWDTSSVTNMQSMFSSCYSLTSLDVSGWDTSGVTNMNGMFYYCNSLTFLDVSGWDTLGVTSMGNMFYYCYSLTSLDVSGWDTSSVINMASLFYNCSSITSLDVSGWDTSSATNMQSMFSSCYSLASLDVSGWDTSGVTSMASMFYYCSSLISLDLSGWDTSSIPNMSNMFSGCNSLASLDVSGWDTSSVTNMGSMFNNCNSLTFLDVSGWDTSSVTNMGSMFSSCYSLTFLDVSEWDTSSVTTMANMFSSCYSLTSPDVSGWDTSSVKNMSGMFNSCASVTSLDVSGWDFSEVTTAANAGNIFSYCYGLSGSLTLPSSMGMIGANCFTSSRSLTEWHFLSTTPPTLNSTNAFSNMTDYGGKKIYVPAASLSAYQTANNWSTYASYMVGE